MVETERRSVAPLIIASVTSTVCTLMVVLGFQAIADQNPATDSVPRVIPYNGVMEFNGQAVTATGDDAPWLRFELSDTSVEGGPQIVFSQSMQVNVYAGKFTAPLGPADDSGVFLQDVIAGADDLVINIVVLGDPMDEADDVALSNPQRFVMSPFAVWATHATNFDVASNLNVGNGLTVNGGATMDTISAGTATIGPMTFTGHDLIFNPSVRGDGGLAFVHGENDSLVLNFDNSFPGGLESRGDFLNFGDMTVNQGLVVNGLASLQSNAWVGGDLDVDGSLLSDRLVVRDATLATMNFNGHDLRYLPSERGDGGSALVHGENDSLILNFDNTFAGGTFIRGNVTIDNLTNVAFDGLAQGFIMQGIPQSNDFDNNVREIVLQSSSTHFCALTHMRIGDDGGQNDAAECDLYVDGDGTWRLKGRTNTETALLVCDASCLRYR